MSTTAQQPSPVKLSFEAYAALKVQAAAERRTLSQVASYAIIEYINANQERDRNDG